MVNLETSLCGLTLSNPLIPASGTFGYGYEFAELYDINILGSFSFKGTTKDARFGNPTPRIAECEAGMINAVGLQNPGVEKVISEELPKLAKCFNIIRQLIILKHKLHTIALTISAGVAIVINFTYTQKHAFKIRYPATLTCKHCFVTRV